MNVPKPRIRYSYALDVWWAETPYGTAEWRRLAAGRYIVQRQSE